VFLRNSSTGKTDEELLHLYQTTRELEWLSALYLRYASLVYGVCLKYLKDRDNAKDAVMQIHEKLIESLLRHKVSNFRSWLYVNARNHCLMQLRSRKKMPTEEIPLFLMENGAEQHLEVDVVLEESIGKLEKCIETLEGAQQQCVRLFYLQEKCYKEVASETGFDLNQVKSYIQNGKRNLKLCMEENGR
jgi:RNA polymerase sigma-70 factor (ECF subfamily)